MLAPKFHQPKLFPSDHYLFPTSCSLTLFFEIGLGPMHPLPKPSSSLLSIQPSRQPFLFRVIPLTPSHLPQLLLFAVSAGSSPCLAVSSHKPHQPPLRSHSIWELPSSFPIQL
ncbi:hypothetical protein ACB092_07G174000 [Castanea dentata]